jgi:hypothetical protein
VWAKSSSIWLVLRKLCLAESYAITFMLLVEFSLIWLELVVKLEAELRVLPLIHLSSIRLEL